MADDQRTENEIPEVETISSPCIVVVSDLIFASKIQSSAQNAGRPCITARSIDELEAALSRSAKSCVFVDMAMHESLSAGAIKLAKQKQPHSTVIAFYAHVKPQLGQLATSAGADHVMPRSQFVASLPNLVVS